MMKNVIVRNSTAEFLTFIAERKEEGIQVLYKNESIWATQKAMSMLFDCSSDNIGLHLKNIFKSGELEEGSVTEKISATAADGKMYMTKFYNLDAIISVGYRVNSIRATQFRQWCTSERRFYQKLTDIYATAVDYNRDAPTTRLFYKKVQNKIHFAVHGHTTAELIVERADAGKEHIGLTTWENAPDGKIVQYSEELPEWCGIGRYGKIGQLRFGYGRENGRQAYSDDYGRLG